MNGQPDKEKAAGTVLNASLPFLKADESVRVEGATQIYVMMNKFHIRSGS